MTATTTASSMTTSTGKETTTPDVQVIHPPRGGDFEIRPNSGLVASTFFDLTASDWAGDDLTYRYSWRPVSSGQSAWMYFGAWSSRTTFKGACFGTLGQVTVRMQVRDGAGALAAESKNISLHAHVLSTERLAEISEALMKKEDSFDSRAAFATAAAKNTESQEDILHILDFLHRTYSNVTSDHLDVLVNASREVVSGIDTLANEGKSVELLNSVGDMVETAVTAATSLDGGLSPSHALSLLGFVGVSLAVDQVEIEEGWRGD